MSAEESAAETEDMSLTSEKAASLTAEEVLDHLKVNPRVGLTTIEASRRRTIYGLNEVVVKEPTPLWKKYLDQVRLFFLSLLLEERFERITNCLSIVFFLVQQSLHPFTSGICYY